MNSLIVTDLSKHYPNFSLSAINFSQEEGTIMGLLGENGAGKTTLIKLLLGAIKPDGGEVNYFETGQDAKNLSIRQDLGFMLDDNAQFDPYRIDQMESILRSAYENWNDELFLGYLEKFSLNPKQKIKTLSTGNKKKLFLAAAMCHGARYLILDEPTSGLDPMSREEIRTMLQEYLASHEASIMFSTHITSDLENIADYLMFIHKGKLLIKGEKDELIDRYALILLNRDQWEDLPKDGVINMRQGNYGIEALVDLHTNLYHKGQATFIEKPTIEQLMLFLLKEEEK